MNEIISTSECPPARRMAAWNEAACKHLTPMSVQPYDAGEFWGRMRRTQLEDIRAVDIACHAASVQRSAAHVARTTEAVFILDLQLEGESVIRQAGREARLSPGDFALTDSTRPHHVLFEKQVAMRLLRVPAATLRRFVGCPEDVVGLRIDGSIGTGRIASQFMQGLWHSNETAKLVTGVSHVERAALELIASAYTQFGKARAKRSSLASVYRMQLIELIEKHLADPGLTPGRLASTLRITPRYLHRVFSNNEETIGRYILRRRLERCAEQLVDALHDRRHVGDIAFAWGFATVSHFCRVFREQYGLSPGDFRSRAQQRRRDA